MRLELEPGGFIRVRRLLCRLGIHQRRQFLCSMCFYLACPPGVAIWIDRCLNPECPEVGPRFCENHRRDDEEDS